MRPRRSSSSRAGAGRLTRLMCTGGLSQRPQQQQQQHEKFFASFRSKAILFQATAVMHAGSQCLWRFWVVSPCLCPMCGHTAAADMCLLYRSLPALLIEIDQCASSRAVACCAGACGRRRAAGQPAPAAGRTQAAARLDTKVRAVQQQAAAADTTGCCSDAVSAWLHETQRVWVGGSLQARRMELP